MIRLERIIDGGNLDGMVLELNFSKDSNHAKRIGEYLDDIEKKGLTDKGYKVVSVREDKRNMGIYHIHISKIEEKEYA